MDGSGSQQVPCTLNTIHCLLARCRAGGAPLTTPVVVTGFVLDPTKARPPTKVDASGMLLVSATGGCVQ